MKKSLLLLSVLGLVACSSTPVRDEGANVDDVPPPVVAGAPKGVTHAPTPTPSPSPVAEPEPERPKTPPAPSQYATLNEAIKAQNDERIYAAATQILAQSPTDAKALNALAMYQYKKSRFELARYLLSKAISANPKSAPLHSNLGVVLLAMKENRDALKAFRKALEIDDEDSVAAANLGAIYVHEKDYAKALIVLETAYKEGLRDVRVLNNYGIALTASGKFDKAADMYKAVLKEQANNRETLFNYASLLVDHMGKYQEGLEVINRLKFVGGPGETRNRIIALENKAKTGLK